MRCDSYTSISVMQEFIRIYSTALLGNHIANKESMPKKGQFAMKKLL